MSKNRILRNISLLIENQIHDTILQGRTPDGRQRREHNRTHTMPRDRSANHSKRDSSHVGEANDPGG